jgi:hypothetical protein
MREVDESRVRVDSCEIEVDRRRSASTSCASIPSLLAASNSAWTELACEWPDWNDADRVIFPGVGWPRTGVGDGDDEGTEPSMGGPENWRTDDTGAVWGKTRSSAGDGGSAEVAIGSSVFRGRRRPMSVFLPAASSGEGGGDSVAARATRGDRDGKINASLPAGLCSACDGEPSGDEGARDVTLTGGLGGRSCIQKASLRFSLDLRRPVSCLKRCDMLFDRSGSAGGGGEMAIAVDSTLDVDEIN